MCAWNALVYLLWKHLKELRREAIREKGSVGDVLRKLVDAWLKEKKDNE